MNRSRSGYVYIVLCAVIFSTMEVMLNAVKRVIYEPLSYWFLPVYH